MLENNTDALTSQAMAHLEKGELSQAKALYEQVCGFDEENAEAWMMLGVINGELGDSGEALSCLRRAIQLQPDLAEAHAGLGNVLRTQGKLQEALIHYRKAAELSPDKAETWMMVGAACGMLGQFAEAADCCRKAIKLQPDLINAHMNLGNALMQQGKLEEELACYQGVIRLQPRFPAAWYMLAGVCARLRRWDQAGPAYEKVLELDPNHAASHSGLASAQQALGNYQEAMKHYSLAAQLNPRDARMLHGMGATLILMGRQQEAVSSFRKALQIDPDYAEAHVGLGAALAALGNSEEALECCEKALRLHPNHPDAASIAASIEEQAGDVERARDRLQPLIRAGIDSANVALAYARVSKRLNLFRDGIAAVERLLNRGPLSNANRRNLHFMLGDLYEAEEEYEQAFTHYRTANDLNTSHFDVGQHEAHVNELITTFNADFIAEMPHATVRSDRPVFVVGMPRSGTTLVEQILASHPAVFGAGELPDIQQLVAGIPPMLESDQGYPACMSLLTQDKVDLLARRYLDRLMELAPEARRVIDKMPDNFMHLGLIALLFPDARIIHCVRDPLDTCLSCYFQNFSLGHPYSYSLSDLGAYYLSYTRIMAHWKEVLEIPVMDVHYEELVQNQEDVSRALVEFCGLEWDERCLRFYETERFVSTASYDQVHQPIYRKSIQRWKNHEKHLDPLKQALAM